MNDDEQNNEINNDSDYVKRLSKYVNKDTKKSLLEKARSIIDMIQEN